jgi:hypothetical protein
MVDLYRGHGDALCIGTARMKNNHPTPPLHDVDVIGASNKPIYQTAFSQRFAKTRIENSYSGRLLIESDATIPTRPIPAIHYSNGLSIWRQGKIRCTFPHSVT